MRVDRVGLLGRQRMGRPLVDQRVLDDLRRLKRLVARVTALVIDGLFFADGRRPCARVRSVLRGDAAAQVAVGLDVDEVGVRILKFCRQG